MMFHYAVLEALGAEELFRLMWVAPDGSVLLRPHQARAQGPGQKRDRREPECLPNTALQGR
jgi:hypothetical protein